MINNLTDNQSIKLGALYGILSALCFAIMCVFVKEIDSSIPLSEVIFIRFLISFILLMFWIAFSKDFSFKLKNPFYHVIRAFLGLLCLLCSFYSIQFIPLVDALLLNNTSPLFVPLIIWMTIGIKTSKIALLGILLGFVGVLLVLHPNNQIFSWPAYIALLGGVLLAIITIFIRFLSQANSSLQILFSYFSISALLSFVLALPEWKMPSNLNIWLMLLGVGIFGALFQLFLTLSYVKASVRYMSILNFLSVFFGGVFDWLLWGIYPKFSSLIGGGLIIIGVMITLFYGSRDKAIQQSHLNF